MSATICLFAVDLHHYAGPSIEKCEYVINCHFCVLVLFEVYIKHLYHINV